MLGKASDHSTTTSLLQPLQEAAMDRGKDQSRFLDQPWSPTPMKDAWVKEKLVDRCREKKGKYFEHTEFGDWIIEGSNADIINSFCPIPNYIRGS